MVKQIPLSSANYPGTVALVDDDDFDDIIRLRWYLRVRPRKYLGDHRYAVHSKFIDGVIKHIQMHRLLLGVEGSVDHRDGDGLNNQRSNLRLATTSQNQANRFVLTPGKSSQYRGVSWCAARSNWRSVIKVSGRSHSLGSFNDESEAAIAYDEAAHRFFGEFARLNFPAAAREREGAAIIADQERRMSQS